MKVKGFKSFFHAARLAVVPGVFTRAGGRHFVTVGEQDGKQKVCIVSFLSFVLSELCR
jgi:hypothetical protein